jgi:hypothetical protein
MVRVVRVLDGRTLAVASTSGESLVVLAGVALRPIDESAGSASRSAEFLRASLDGRWVMIEREPAAGSAVATPLFWVYRSPDGLDVSREVIRRGLALPARQPCSRAADLLEAEREARGEGPAGLREIASPPAGSHTMTYLGTIDPPHVRRDANGVFTTRAGTAKPRSAPRRPVIVVIERPPAPQ